MQHLQNMVNAKMLKKCDEWNYYAKAREQAFQQIRLLVQQKLDSLGKKGIEVIIEESSISLQKH
ncbi:MAG: hypothetical protein II956_11345 [Bacteroidales bacterium]|nr:hypothetical protein [Bacteroidales bacterium]